MPFPPLSFVYAQYPAIIAQMPVVFTSHEFILRLAQRNQAGYIEALHICRADEPFRKVHGLLARQLHQHSALVIQLPDAPSSLDIFNEPQICARCRSAEPPLSSNQGGARHLKQRRSSATRDDFMHAFHPSGRKC